MLQPKLAMPNIPPGPKDPPPEDPPGNPRPEVPPANDPVEPAQPIELPGEVPDDLPVRTGASGLSCRRL